MALVIGIVALIVALMIGIAHFENEQRLEILEDKVKWLEEEKQNGK